MARTLTMKHIFELGEALGRLEERVVVGVFAPAAGGLLKLEL